jgi:hypothetical protein
MTESVVQKSAAPRTNVGLDSNGNLQEQGFVGDAGKTSAPIDYPGTPSEYAADNVGLHSADTRFIDSISTGAKIVEITVADTGASTLDSVFVYFNPAGVDAAARLATAKAAFAVAVGTTVNTTATAVDYKTVLMGERRIFIFDDDALCTDIYIGGNVALSGTNNVKIEYKV